MPRFDGTGPMGDGPMTGRGEGYCVLELSESGRPVRGYGGMQGSPMRWDVSAARPTGGYILPDGTAVRWERPRSWPFLSQATRRVGPRPALGRGRRWAVGRGRGRRTRRGMFPLFGTRNL